jgi:hypothetical protein
MQQKNPIDDHSKPDLKTKACENYFVVLAKSEKLASDLIQVIQFCSNRLEFFAGIMKNNKFTE